MTCRTMSLTRGTYHGSTHSFAAGVTAGRSMWVRSGSHGRVPPGLRRFALSFATEPAHNGESETSRGPSGKSDETRKARRRGLPLSRKSLPRSDIVIRSAPFHRLPVPRSVSRDVYCFIRETQTARETSSGTDAFSGTERASLRIPHEGLRTRSQRKFRTVRATESGHPGRKTRTKR